MVVSKALGDRAHLVAEPSEIVVDGCMNCAHGPVSIAGVARDRGVGSGHHVNMTVLAIAVQKYAAVFLFTALWVGIVMAGRGLLRWLAEQRADDLGF